jgi:hypothetical protein
LQRRRYCGTLNQNLSLMFSLRGYLPTGRSLFHTLWITLRDNGCEIIRHMNGHLSVAQKMPLLVYFSCSITLPIYFCTVILTALTIGSGSAEGLNQRIQGTVKERTRAGLVAFVHELVKEARFFDKVITDEHVFAERKKIHDDNVRKHMKAKRQKLAHINSYRVRNHHSGIVLDETTSSSFSSTTTTTTTTSTINTTAFAPSPTFSSESLTNTLPSSVTSFSTTTDQTPSQPRTTGDYLYDDLFSDKGMDDYANDELINDDSMVDLLSPLPGLPVIPESTDNGSEKASPVCSQCGGKYVY